MIAFMSRVQKSRRAQDARAHAAIKAGDQRVSKYTIPSIAFPRRQAVLAGLAVAEALRVEAVAEQEHYPFTEHDSPARYELIPPFARKALAEALEGLLA